jgi:hypothetical protein
MSDNTGQEGNLPEDNEVIRGLRQDVKDLTKAVKTAGDDAIAKVKRGAVASSLMPEGFEGLADIFESEVDGELTKEAAAEWLATRGFTASSDEASEEAAEQAANLEAVTNLGGAVAAAGSLTPEDSVITGLGEIVKPGTPQSLDDVTKAIESLIHG